jgi:mevalonate kinase
LPADQISALAFEVEKLHHGTPSGIDNTVITYAQPLYFIKDRVVEVFQVKSPFTIIIGDTGIPSLTKTAVKTVRNLWDAQPRRAEEIFDKISGITYRARSAIESGELSTLGSLMDENQTYLQELKVSSQELNQLIEAARSAGAEGAKLSGGGIGGNMIALVRPENTSKVSRALQEAGAKRTITTRVE